MLVLIMTLVGHLTVKIAHLFISHLIFFNRKNILRNILKIVFIMTRWKPLFSDDLLYERALY